ncbi:MAG: helix-turn-helix domain-containing protein [Microlunatus sp.]
MNRHHGSGIQETIDELAEFLGHPVLIEDADHQPLWWSEQHDVDQTRVRTFLRRSIDPAARAMLRRLRVSTALGPVRTPALPEIDMRARWCHPLRVGRTLVGYLWVVDDQESLEDDARTAIAACARQAEAVLAESLNEVDARLRRRAELIGRLTAGPDPQAAEELIKLENLGPDATVVVIDHGRGGLRGRGWALDAGFWALPDPLPGMPAASGKPLPLGRLGDAVDRARITRRVLAAGGQPERATYDALGIWRLVAAAPEDLNPDDIHPGATALHNLARPDLLETAETLIRTGVDVTAASEHLHVHRTTLYYRMERIAAVTGVDLRGDPHFCDLDLALKLIRYRSVK